MFQFLESICFKEEAYQLLEYHQARIDQTFSQFYPKAKPFRLDETLPELSGNELIKVRLIYNERNHEISWSRYSPKPISQLRLIASSFNYSFKYLERSQLNQLLPPGNTEDVIIMRDGDITDTSYSNLIFKQGSLWYTPDTYLLNGVKRQHLLDHKLIKERTIKPKDLQDYQEVSLINAMLEPGDISLPIDRILS